MKKTYIKPATFRYDMEVESVIALSTITGEKADGSAVLSRKQNVWDEEEEEW